MRIEAIFESWDGRDQGTVMCGYGHAFCHIDEHSGRLLVARPTPIWGGNVIVHEDDYEGDPNIMTYDAAKEICVPETVIAEIIPFGRKTFDIHRADGGESLLTIKNLPLVRIFPVRESIS